MNASCGYSSAACGTDIIFLESMIERGAETHIFLPFAKKDFIEISVRRAGGIGFPGLKEFRFSNLNSLCDKGGYYGENALFSFVIIFFLGLPP